METTGFLCLPSVKENQMIKMFHTIYTQCSIIMHDKTKTQTTKAERFCYLH